MAMFINLHSAMSPAKEWDYQNTDNKVVINTIIYTGFNKHCLDQLVYILNQPFSTRVPLEVPRSSFEQWLTDLPFNGTLQNPGANAICQRRLYDASDLSVRVAF